MNADDLARFLRSNPQFFEQHPGSRSSRSTSRIRTAGAPFRSPSARRWRCARRSRALEGRLAELIQFGAENDAISEKVHRLSVALVGAPDFPALTRSLYFHLREDFAVPHVALRVWGKSVPADFDEAQPVDDGASASTRRRMGAPQCGPAQGNAFALLVRRGRASTSARSRWCRSAQTRGLRPARARQRGREALLPGDGHALPAPHRRAVRGRSHRAAVAVDASAARSDYLDALKHQRRLSPAHARELRAARSTCCSAATGQPLARLEPAEVRRYVAMLHAKGLSPRTLALVLSAWRGWFRWLARHRGFSANPVLGIRAPKAARPLPKALSVEATQQLLDAPKAIRPRASATGRCSSSSIPRACALAELVALDVDDGRLDLAAGRGDRHRQGLEDAHRADRREGARGARAPGSPCAASSRIRTRRRSSSARAAGASRPRCVGARLAAWARASGLPRARASAHAAPLVRDATCCSPRRTCARCRRCSATRASRPRRSTRTSTSRRWPRSTTPRIRAPQERNDRS